MTNPTSIWTAVFLASPVRNANANSRRCEKDVSVIKFGYIILCILAFPNSLLVKNRPDYSCLKAKKYGPLDDSSEWPDFGQKACSAHHFSLQGGLKNVSPVMTLWQSAARGESEGEFYSRVRYSTLSCWDHTQSQTWHPIILESSN